MSRQEQIARGARLFVACVVLGMLAAGVARAQTPDRNDEAAQAARRRPSTSRPSIGVRGFVSFDNNFLTAVNTFDAVLGTSRLTALGGGGEVLGLWRGLFVRVEGSSMKKTGSRVVVVDKAATSLGIPITVQMMPVAFGVGWRSDLGLRRRAAVYAGASFLHLVYRETSTFAGPNENTDTTFNGKVVFGGIDTRVWKFLVAGAEAQYRSVPKAIGTAGASQAFGETDLGGGTLRVLVGVKF